MNTNIDIEFQEEPAVEIQPVTGKTKPKQGLRCNFLVGWQLFGRES